MSSPPATHVTLRVRIIMQTFVGLLVLSLGLAVSASPYVSRVVGGSDAPEGKYPYQVSLWDDGTKFYCGGSIINDRYILTAAHCLYGRKAERVAVGVGNRLLNETVDFYAAERLIPHNGFIVETFHNDIGLIRLAKKIVYGDNIKPIPVAVQDLKREDYPATLTGWGRLFAKGPVPNCLQEIELRVISPNACRNVVGESEGEPTQICTFTRLGQGSCDGDSGGPLVADGYQVGIVSFGMPCARGAPDVFTRVYSFVDWIAETMADDRQ